MDLKGFEPLTSSMPWKRAPNCATGPRLQDHHNIDPPRGGQEPHNVPPKRVTRGAHPTMGITMHRLHRQGPVALALILGLFSTSCLYTKRFILRHGKPVTAASAPPLQTATRQQLVSHITAIYDAINSLQATVDMAPSVGSVYKGEITDIKDVRAYVLFRKPFDIRIIGQLPVVRTKAFDMVSNGTSFKVYLVSRNLFVEGANSAPPISKNKIENLRPDAFLSSMLIPPPHSGVEHVFLEDDTDEEDAFYILNFVKQTPSGEILLTRNVWFDRINLAIVRQKTFDDSGNTVSDTRYGRWALYNGVMFPSQIDINRPQDGYGMTMTVVDMQMNLALTDDKFLLTQPEGTTVQTIGANGK